MQRHHLFVAYYLLAGFEFIKKKRTFRLHRIYFDSIGNVIYFIFYFFSISLGREAGVAIKSRKILPIK